MASVRRTALWATLIGIGVLAALSVAGAFLGDRRAGALFNALPLAVFWVLLTSLLIAGAALFPGLRRSAGLLATHVGCALVLVGSMAGSDRGHRLTHRLLGREKTPAGKMIIFEGEESNRLFDVADDGGVAVTGELPFSVRLRDFWIEYYEPWPLLVAGEAAEGDVERAPARIDWAVGKEVGLPGTEARLTVTQYLENSRPIYALEATGADGGTLSVPATEGREVPLDDPKTTVRIVRVFSHLRVEGAGEELRVFDVPGSSANPAVEVELAHADGTTTRQFVMAGFPARHGRQSVVGFRYPASGDPIDAAADPGRRLPAMEVLVRHKGRQVKRWLVPREGDHFARLPLADLLGGPDGEEDPEQEKPDADGAAQHVHVPALYLVKPSGSIKDFKSDVVVLEEKREVVRKTIEVNDPLHYGGYHFYQQSYDEKHGRYTVLSVRSDSGLGAVYVGFFLVGAGVIWLFWVKPVLGRVARRRDNGG